MTVAMDRRYTWPGFQAEREFWRAMRDTDPDRRHRLEHESGVILGNDPSLIGPRLLAWWFNVWHGAAVSYTLPNDRHGELFTLSLPLPQSTWAGLCDYCNRRIPEIEAGRIE